MKIMQLKEAASLSRIQQKAFSIDYTLFRVVKYKLTQEVT